MLCCVCVQVCVHAPILSTSLEACSSYLREGLCSLQRVHKNLFWQLSRDGNMHRSGMSHAMTASPKPSFRAPCRVGDAVVWRGNAGWTTSAHARIAHKGFLKKRPEDNLCWIVPHVPPTTQLVKRLNWNELIMLRCLIGADVFRHQETCPLLILKFRSDTNCLWLCYYVLACQPNTAVTVRVFHVEY